MLLWGISSSTWSALDSLIRDGGAVLPLASLHGTWTRRTIHAPLWSRFLVMLILLHHPFSFTNRCCMLLRENSCLSPNNALVVTYFLCLLCMSSGKTSLLFQFAISCAQERSSEVVFICNKGKLESKPPFLSEVSPMLLPLTQFKNSTWKSCIHEVKLSIFVRQSIHLQMYFKGYKLSKILDA